MKSKSEISSSTEILECHLSALGLSGMRPEIVKVAEAMLKEKAVKFVRGWFESYTETELLMLLEVLKEPALRRPSNEPLQVKAKGVDIVDRPVDNVKPMRTERRRK